MIAMVTACKLNTFVAMATYLYTYLASSKLSLAVCERAQLMTVHCLDLRPSAGTITCTRRLLLISA